VSRHIKNLQLPKPQKGKGLISPHYWGIGRDILDRQKSEGWGAKVVDRLAHDLLQAFPGMTGFGARNLKYMRAFAEAYPEQQFVQQVVAQLPWGHNVRILEMVKAPGATGMVYPAGCREWLDAERPCPLLLSSS
jgi:hypothetical protein